MLWDDGGKRAFNLYHSMLTFNAPWEDAYVENFVGKGENSGKQPIKEKLHHSSHVEIVVCKCFHSDYAET